MQVFHPLSLKIFTSFACWLQVYLTLIYACEWCMSKLAYLSAADASPPAPSEHPHCSCSLRLLHITWLDSGGHIKPALSGFVFIPQVTNVDQTCLWISVYVYGCFFGLPVFMALCGVCETLRVCLCIYVYVCVWVWVCLFTLRCDHAAWHCVALDIYGLCCCDQAIWLRDLWQVSPLKNI